MKLYAHPFSSYSQKVLIALYENATLFEYRNLEEPAANAELAALWPLKRFPVLLDDGRCILESSTIVAHLQAHHPGPVCLIPPGDAGLEVHMLDRIFDNYVMTPMQKVVLDALRPVADRDRYGVAEAREMLNQIYPSLFYADWAHEIPAGYGRLRAYRARLLNHPSIVRVVEEARPFRHYFPLGAPARD
ncbi:glutathione S-transferase family protein [Aeromonas caviae]|uniref:glutathione S-transferase family protein n=1 Tax=Aeromonas caviae TaxID=648 RepID=UPI0005367767|nr:glutathione S-transferase family protein [Aeromonas caviae]PNO56688.1 glutathione S-transferase family protein [Aeromonas caviae]QUL99766.1 glutathione S-transferase family protein [Aeromonas caviae]